MTRPKAKDYATTDELKWFSTEKYSDLRKASATYDFWSKIIQDRLWIQTQLAAGHKEIATNLFKKIQLSPLTHLGYGYRYRGPSHSSDTPTVKLLTVSRLAGITNSVRRSKASEKSFVDEELRAKNDGIFNDFAHLMINIRSTDDQIVEDFTSWLSSWRKITGPVVGGDLMTKTQSWAKTCVVEYMDLNLFTSVTGKPIKNSVKLAMLFPKHNNDQREAARRRALGLCKTVFSQQMALTLQHLGQQDQCD